MTIRRSGYEDLIAEELASGRWEGRRVPRSASTYSRRDMRLATMGEPYMTRDQRAADRERIAREDEETKQRRLGAMVLHQELVRRQGRVG